MKKVNINSTIAASTIATYSYLQQIVEDDIRDKINVDLVNALTKELDKGFMDRMRLDAVKAAGWHKISIRKQLIPRDWLKENIKRGWEDHGSDWYFEDKHDAAWFALRWS